MVKKISLDDVLDKKSFVEKINDLSFEDGLKLLDELVQKVESGSLPLDKAVLSYEGGVVLIEKLRGLLSGAEEKLKILQKA
jgi:exodeoxyribonuclease VII small subunit